MGLREYQRKRRFDKTTEPRGKQRGKQGWSFVVQKHDASRLHYDFRLEHNGVLLSWAVPKGPSLDPSEKRLAVQIEDHPVEYGTFEGTIPQGEYGGGTVLLWDRGTWQPIGSVEAGLRIGKLKFRLQGRRLNGRWMLLRLGGQKNDGRQWLLFKERDEEALPHAEYNVTAEETKSVVSRRSMDQIASAKNGKVWSSSGQAKRSARNGQRQKVRQMEPATRSQAKITARARHSKADARKMPATIKTQLATLVEQPPEGDDWLNEIKFDGYRIVAFVESGKVRLQSRNLKDWTARFSNVAASVQRIDVANAIFDGEVVALNDQGLSNFQDLQNVLKDGSQSKLVYFVFDLLWLDGEDLRALPLAERKERLKALKLPKNRSTVRFVEHIVGHGDQFFAEACKIGLEGIISKRLDRAYVPLRSMDWLKCKCESSAEFVIGGFTEPEGARHGFGALLLGYFDDAKKFTYAGRVGTGFDDKMLQDLGKQLRAREVKTRPFEAGPVARERHAHWVRPELVAQVRFTNWTRDQMLRHPAFLGLREDKPAISVGRETAKPAKKAGRRAKTTNRAATHAPGEDTIDGVRVTHPEKALYPDNGITKRDLAEYYLRVAERMLPHVVDRPLSIVRCPDGIAGQRFFQKHPSAGMLAGLEQIKIKEKAETDDYVYIRRAADLVELVQFGALELHLWGSKIDDLEKPDRLVFDLDPAPDVPWKRVAGAAVVVRERLLEVGLQSFLKTSGGKGLHVVVPIARRHDWDTIKQLCRRVAEVISLAAPGEYLATMSKAARHGKIYIDYLRNQRGATAIAPYSTRASAGAPVSLPIAWRDLPRLKSADGFTVANVSRWLRKADPWAQLNSTRQSLSAKTLSAFGV